MPEEKVSVARKALMINLEPRIYGSFAEIGAGQEVARNFFSVGAASGTIAKTISAYDMKFSDEIYGPADRYVSRERLMGMLEHEYGLLIDRLAETRGADTTFFAFANTVSARNFHGTNRSHGWMGIRFQFDPQGPPNDLILHVRLKDIENIQQQQAIGILGVNIIYAAFFHRSDPVKFMSSLLDDLSIERIEVDMMEVNGPDVEGIDNRIVGLRLLQSGLTPAVLLGPQRDILKPYAALRRSPVVVARGRFRPVTNANLDMVQRAEELFQSFADKSKGPCVTLFEISLQTLISGNEVDLEDFLQRADAISALGYHVLLTNYNELYKVSEYIRTHTSEPLAFALGVNQLIHVFEESYYRDLPGGVLEATGRAFSHQTKLLVYPMKASILTRYYEERGINIESFNISPESLVTATRPHIPRRFQKLYEYLFDNDFIVEIDRYEADFLDAFPRDIEHSTEHREPNWEDNVPEAVAKVLSSEGLISTNSE